MSDDLTIKEKLFVKELINNPHQTNTEALVKAGYNPTTPNSAKQMASEVFNRPRVQSALEVEIAKKFPDFTELSAEVLFRGLADPTIPYKEKLAAVKLAAEIMGWKAPTKSAKVSVNWKLPEE